MQSSDETNVLEPFTEIVDDVTVQNAIALGGLLLAVLLAIGLHALFFRLALKSSGEKREQLLFRVLRKTQYVSRLALIVLAVEIDPLHPAASSFRFGWRRSRTRAACICPPHTLSNLVISSRRTSG